MGGRDQRCRGERLVVLMQGDIGKRLQPAEAARAVLRRARLRRVGQQNSQARHQRTYLMRV
jgi:hypothetical protein